MKEPWNSDEEKRQLYMGPDGAMLLTEAEAQAWRDQRSAAQAIGDSMYSYLPDYGKTTYCAMCNQPLTEARVEISYCSSGVHQYCLQTAGVNQHMHVTCKRCGYGFIEKTYQDSANPRSR